jgi:hypothetical protein
MKTGDEMPRKLDHIIRQQGVLYSLFCGNSEALIGHDTNQYDI